MLELSGESRKILDRLKARTLPTTIVPSARTQIVAVHHRAQATAESRVLDRTSIDRASPKSTGAVRKREEGERERERESDERFIGTL